jgi:hypothetical protein
VPRASSITGVRNIHAHMLLTHLHHIPWYLLTARDEACAHRQQLQKQLQYLERWLRAVQHRQQEHWHACWCGACAHNRTNRCQQQTATCSSHSTTVRAHQ